MADLAEPEAEVRARRAATDRRQNTQPKVSARPTDNPNQASHEERIGRLEEAIGKIKSDRIKFGRWLEAKFTEQTEQLRAQDAVYTERQQEQMDVLDEKLSALHGVIERQQNQGGIEHTNEGEQVNTNRQGISLLFAVLAIVIPVAGLIGASHLSLASRMDTLNVLIAEKIGEFTTDVSSMRETLERVEVAHKETNEQLAETNKKLDDFIRVSANPVE